MTTHQDTYTTWKTYPTGKIPKGTFCDHCARYNTRNCTVEVIVLDENNRVLLIERNIMPQEGWWALPGGYLGWEETLAQAATREIKEETGLTLSNIAFFRLFDDPTRDLDDRQNVGHCFVGRVRSSAELKHDHEVKKIQWFALSELPKDIAFDHRRMIEEYFASISSKGAA